MLSFHTSYHDSLSIIYKSWYEPWYYFSNTGYNLVMTARTSLLHYHYTFPPVPYLFIYFGRGRPIILKGGGDLQCTFKCTITFSFDFARTIWFSMITDAFDVITISITVFTFIKYHITICYSTISLCVTLRSPCYFYQLQSFNAIRGILRSKIGLLRKL